MRLDQEELNRKIIKWFRLQRLLRCTRCPANKGENRKKSNQYRKIVWEKPSNWKFRTKRKRQYQKEGWQSMA